MLIRACASSICLDTAPRKSCYISKINYSYEVRILSPCLNKSIFLRQQRTSLIFRQYSATSSLYMAEVYRYIAQALQHKKNLTILRVVRFFYATNACGAQPCFFSASFRKGNNFFAISCLLPLTTKPFNKATLSAEPEWEQWQRGDSLKEYLHPQDQIHF